MKKLLPPSGNIVHNGSEKWNFSEIRNLGIRFSSTMKKQESRCILSRIFLGYQRLGTKDFECRFWRPKTCYLVAMLYKFFEGTCLKNRKKCWESLDVNWFRGQDSMNKQGFWEWSGCQSLVPLAIEYQRFASIRAWADENHKLFSLCTWGQSGFEV